MRGRAKTNKGGGNPSLKLGYYSNWNICRLHSGKRSSFRHRPDYTGSLSGEPENVGATCSSCCFNLV